MLAPSLILLVLLGVVLLPFVLYVLVRAEHDHRETMDRDAGERAARRDTEDHRRESR